MSSIQSFTSVNLTDAIKQTALQHVKSVIASKEWNVLSVNVDKVFESTTKTTHKTFVTVTAWIQVMGIWRPINRQVQFVFEKQPGRDWKFLTTTPTE